ncbi:hypothetical protein ACPEEZ_09455 [Frigoribacterium sp. 2-23]|uniref:hypothetical protein n=1 Tax=Frigoribacterium sp. 2-23 TaxID=3415006 RepID=UPI003C701D30
MFFLGVACAILAVVLADSLSNGDSRIALGIKASAIALVLSGVGQVGVELMLLEGRLVFFNITRASVLMLPSVGIIVAFFTGLLSLVSAYVIMLAGQLIAVALGCIFAMKNGRRSKSTKVPWDFSLKYWSTSALDAIGGRGDQVALSALSQASTVGVYSLAVTCAAASAGLTEALNNLAYSRLTRLSGAESEEFLRRRSILGVCCSLVSGACIVIVVHFFGRSLFGPTFDGLTAVVIILVLAQTVGDQWSLRVLADSAKESATTLIFASVAGLIVLATAIALLATNAAITSASMALAILLFSLTRLTIWTLAQKR